MRSGLEHSSTSMESLYSGFDNLSVANPSLSIFKSTNSDANLKPVVSEQKKSFFEDA